MDDNYLNYDSFLVHKILQVFRKGVVAVSYTHLTLPTK